MEHNVIDQYSLLYSARGEGMAVLFYKKTEGDEYHRMRPVSEHLRVREIGEGMESDHPRYCSLQRRHLGQSTQASVHLISGERYAVIFRDGDMHQGWCVEASTIMAKLGDTFTTLLFTITAQNDDAGNGWSSELAFKENDGALRELEVRRSPYEDPTNFIFLDGRDELKHLVADYMGKIRPYDLFKFDGISYTYSPAIK